jgi:hypothetical protein
VIIDRDTNYGFEFGAAKFQRLHRDRATGAVWVEVSTPREQVHIRVTASGMVRIWDCKKKAYRKAPNGATL